MIEVRSWDPLCLKRPELDLEAVPEVLKHSRPDGRAQSIARVRSPRDVYALTEDDTNLRTMNGHCRAFTKDWHNLGAFSMNISNAVFPHFEITWVAQRFDMPLHQYYGVKLSVSLIPLCSSR